MPQKNGGETSNFLGAKFGHLQWAIWHQDSKSRQSGTKKANGQFGTKIKKMRPNIDALDVDKMIYIVQLNHFKVWCQIVLV